MDSVNRVRDGSRCLIHSTAMLSSDIQLGEFTSIMKGVHVGSGCRIGNYVVIHPDTIIEDGVRIDDHVTVGKLPMRAVASAFVGNVELAPARIGQGCLIGTSAILYRGCRVGNHVLIADQATVREQSRVGDYTIVGRGVAIECQVDVGRRCKIEAGAYIAGPSEIGDGCFIAPEVVVTNDNFMGRTEARKLHFKGISIETGGRIGANATVLPGKEIAPDGVVAAGAVVTRHVPARTIFAGIPARKFGQVPCDQLWPNQQSKYDGNIVPDYSDINDASLNSDHECTRKSGDSRTALFFDEFAFKYITAEKEKESEHGR